MGAVVFAPRIDATFMLHSVLHAKKASFLVSKHIPFWELKNGPDPWFEQTGHRRTAFPMWSVSLKRFTHYSLLSQATSPKVWTKKKIWFEKSRQKLVVLVFWLENHQFLACVCAMVVAAFFHCKNASTGHRRTAATNSALVMKQPAFGLLFTKDASPRKWALWSLLLGWMRRFCCTR